MKKDADGVMWRGYKPRLYTGCPELLIHHNQGHMIIVPTPEGRFEKYFDLRWVKEDGSIANEWEIENEGHAWNIVTPGWVFMNHHPEGRQGLISGSFADGEAAEALLASLGFAVAYTSNLSVPFSRGVMDRGPHMNHYLPTEFARVLPSFPGITELRELANIQRTYKR